MLPERMIGAQQGGAPMVVDARGPRHERLRREADWLRLQAAQGRFKVAHQAGSVEATSVEDLVSVCHLDPMRIAPSAADIIVFVGSRTEGAATTTTPLTVHLEWVRGEIVAAHSRVIRFQPSAETGPTVPKTGATIDEILGDPVGALVDGA